jgi:glutamine amidotransferase
VHGENGFDAGSRMIVVVDYGMGNVGSILNMFNKVGAKAIVSNDPLEILRASKLVLPGVGAFDSGMCNLKALGLTEVLCQKVLDEKTPILGICLGTQLMSKSSEEGTSYGLGWIDADTVRFRVPNASGLRVPHMGWNEVCPAKESRLLSGLDTPARFYFVHSYHLVCHQETDTLLTSNYGCEFVAAVERDNIFGLQIFRNFASLS